MVLSVGLIHSGLAVFIDAIATLVLVEAVNVVCQSRRSHDGKGGKHRTDTQDIVRRLSLKEELRSDDVVDG